MARDGDQPEGLPAKERWKALGALIAIGLFVWAAVALIDDWKAERAAKRPDPKFMNLPPARTTQDRLPIADGKLENATSDQSDGANAAATRP